MIVKESTRKHLLLPALLVFQFNTINEESLIAFGRYLKNGDPAVNGFLYDDITTRVERDLRPNPESSRFILNLIALDQPAAQRTSKKDFWDLSLLDEIRRSGFPYSK